MEHLLQNTRWSILEAVSERPASPTEIAQRTKTSLPNVSQQVKLLEAYGLVERAKEKRPSVGKPRQQYAIKKPFCSLAFATQGDARKQFFNPTEEQLTLLRTFFLHKNDQPFILKMLLCNEEILEKCSVAYVKSSAEEIDIFLLTDDVDDIRKKHSNTFVECFGKQRKVVAWTHSIKEVRDGLAQNDQYFVSMCKSLHILHDPRQQFMKVREETDE